MRLEIFSCVYQISILVLIDYRRFVADTYNSMWVKNFLFTGNMKKNKKNDCTALVALDWHAQTRGCAVYRSTHREVASIL